VHVEAQVQRRRDLVDVLAARTLRADGRPLDLDDAVPARRITVAVFVTMARRPSAARWDRPSWTKRMLVLSATMTPITTVALLSALKKDSRARAVSSRLNGLR